jgi:hypothetical protein
MATSFHSQDGNQDKIQDILKPSCGWTVVKPKGIVGATTIIRLFPEVAPDGTILPMVVGHDANGPIFSNLMMEKMAFYAGTHTKFHGVVRPTDAGYRDLGDPDLPFAGLYISLKGDINKNRIQDPAVFKEVSQLLNKTEKGSAPLSNVQDHVLGQGMVLQLNGQNCEPMIQRGVIVFGANALKALQVCLTQAASMGIDVFDPKAGYALQIDPVATAGSKVVSFNINPVAAPGQAPVPFPLPAELMNAWVPWDDILRRYTYDELIQKMVIAYGANIVSLKPAFRDRIEQLKLASAPAPATTGYVARPASAPAPTSGWGARPAAPTAPTAAPAAQTPAPAPAPSGWGKAAPTPASVAPVAPSAPPVAAPTAGGWGAVQAPASVAPTAPTPAPAGTAAPVDLEAAYKRILEQQQKK